ncbi:DeoR/GlpR family DNA-binding transcription regulator [Budvicia diplopodorum]|uniref:DeoR/GlpR family DNA-binding transcription regulator n=1 Tax=Budvicia diplopodorum TaxID=1119056 RepID=UPI00135AFF5F|nr:DeoR/GlpR family DNA-binding transcription regulator [Budvicia diplopodorum]
MNSFERRNLIVDMVNTSGSVLVSNLSSNFDISEVTIRSDLRQLEKKGLLVRFHGGASKVSQDKGTLLANELRLEERYEQALAPKMRIAILAASFVKPGETVILDSGSTTLLIAEELVKIDNITVITNNLPAAFALSENKEITLFVCGGTLRHKTRSMHGSITEQSLNGIVANIMFVGADGIDAEKGITTFNEGFAISGVMANTAHRVIAVIDSSKFGRSGFNQVLPIDKLDTIITDEGISDQDKAAFQQKNITVLTA